MAGAKSDPRGAALALDGAFGATQGFGTECPILCLILMIPGCYQSMER
jgi:hypothetical protein